MNGVDKVFTGEIINYFEFSVVSKDNGEPLVLHRFPQGDSKVRFRGGNGKIVWSDDSSTVKFEGDGEALWEYRIAEADEPRLPTVMYR